MSVNIRTEQFEGPLDLLLQLIENQKMDITSMSLASVTEQFLEYVRTLLTPTSTSPDEVGRGGQEKNPLNLADFLVIAAKLLVIKSRALLPDLEFAPEEEETAYDLTAQLLVYKKYKEVAKFLKKMDARRFQSWTRETEFHDRITFVPDLDVTSAVLSEALQKLARELKEILKLPEQILTEVVSITQKIEQIQKLITEKVQTTLSSLLKDSKSKTEVIVTFLALLELIKQRILTVEQTEMFADIIIKKNNRTGANAAN